MNPVQERITRYPPPGKRGNGGKEQIGLESIIGEQGRERAKRIMDRGYDEP